MEIFTNRDTGFTYIGRFQDNFEQVKAELRQEASFWLAADGALASQYKHPQQLLLNP